MDSTEYVADPQACYLCADGAEHGKSEHLEKVADMERLQASLTGVAMPEGWSSITA